MASDRRKRDKKCFVCGCIKSKNKNEDIAFFRWPKDEEQSVKWSESLGLDPEKKPQLTTFVCRAHFSDNDVGCKRLKRGAVPFCSTNTDEDDLSFILKALQDENDVELLNGPNLSSIYNALCESEEPDEQELNAKEYEQTKQHEESEQHERMKQFEETQQHAKKKRRRDTERSEETKQHENIKRYKLAQNEKTEQHKEIKRCQPTAQIGETEDTEHYEEAKQTMPREDNKQYVNTEQSADTEQCLETDLYEEAEQYEEGSQYEKTEQCLDTELSEEGEQYEEAMKFKETEQSTDQYEEPMQHEETNQYRDTEQCEEIEQHDTAGQYEDAEQHEDTEQFEDAEQHEKTDTEEFEDTEQFEDTDEFEDTEEFEETEKFEDTEKFKETEQYEEAGEMKQYENTEQFEETGQNEDTEQHEDTEQFEDVGQCENTQEFEDTEQFEETELCKETKQNEEAGEMVQHEDKERYEEAGQDENPAPEMQAGDAATKKEKYPIFIDDTFVLLHTFGNSSIYAIKSLMQQQICPCDSRPEITPPTVPEVNKTSHTEAPTTNISNKLDQVLEVLQIIVQNQNDLSTKQSSMEQQLKSLEKNSTQIADHFSQGQLKIEKNKAEQSPCSLKSEISYKKLDGQQNTLSTKHAIMAQHFKKLEKDSTENPELSSQSQNLCHFKAAKKRVEKALSCTTSENSDKKLDELNNTLSIKQPIMVQQLKTLGKNSTPKAEHLTQRQNKVARNKLEKSPLCNGKGEISDTTLDELSTQKAEHLSQRQNKVARNKVEQSFLCNVTGEMSDKKPDEFQNTLSTKQSNMAQQLKNLGTNSTQKAEHLTQGQYKVARIKVEQSSLSNITGEISHIKQDELQNTLSTKQSNMAQQLKNLGTNCPQKAEHLTQRQNKVARNKLEKSPLYNVRGEISDTTLDELQNALYTKQSNVAQQLKNKVARNKLEKSPLSNVRGEISDTTLDELQNTLYTKQSNVAQQLKNKVARNKLEKFPLYSVRGEISDTTLDELSKNTAEHISQKQNKIVRSKVEKSPLSNLTAEISHKKPMMQNTLSTKQSNMAQQLKNLGKNSPQKAEHLTQGQNKVGRNKVEKSPLSNVRGEISDEKPDELQITLSTKQSNMAQQFKNLGKNSTQKAEHLTQRQYNVARNKVEQSFLCNVTGEMSDKKPDELQNTLSTKQSNMAQQLKNLGTNSPQKAELLTQRQNKVAINKLEKSALSNVKVEISDKKPDELQNTLSTKQSNMAQQLRNLGTNSPQKAQLLTQRQNKVAINKLEKSALSNVKIEISDKKPDELQNTLSTKQSDMAQQLKNGTQKDGHLSQGQFMAVENKLDEAVFLSITGAISDKRLDELARLLPIRLKKDVARVEEKLLDPEYAKAMTTYLHRIKGVSQEVSYVVGQIFTDHVMEDFNWTGRSDKEALNKLRLFNTVLRDVFKHKEKQEFEKAMRKSVELSHQRSFRKNLIKRRKSVF